MTRPYRPSNGTEGEIFQQQWCANCRHGRLGEAGPCDILLQSMTFDLGEPQYPAELVQDDAPFPNSNPRCTAFDAGLRDPAVRIEDPRQDGLAL